MWEAVKHNGAWHAQFNGKYQRLGLIFNNPDTNERLIRDAVRRLNQGQKDIMGTKGWYKVHVDSQGKVSVTPNDTPACMKFA